MSLGLVILSRMDSTRLPGKALRFLGNKTLLEWCIQRCKSAKKVDQVIVATSDRDVDHPIAMFCDDMGQAVFRGSGEDVLGRIKACADTFKLDHIIRISGDSPFIDPIIIDHMITQHLEKQSDFTTNVMPRTYPPGCSVEIIKKDVLNKISDLVQDKEEREHVTSYLYSKQDDFKIQNILNPMGDQSDVVLTLDTVEDYERLAQIGSYVDIDTPVSEVIRISLSLKEENKV